MVAIIREIRSELRTDAAYAIYSACMYRPTREKYLAMVGETHSDPETLCLGAFRGRPLRVVSFFLTSRHPPAMMVLANS